VNLDGGEHALRCDLGPESSAWFGTGPGSTHYPPMEPWFASTADSPSVIRDHLVECFFFYFCCSHSILKKGHALYDDGCFDFFKLHKKKKSFFGILRNFPTGKDLFYYDPIFQFVHHCQPQK
jgi:hypothetical protein